MSAGLLCGSPGLGWGHRKENVTPLLMTSQASAVGVD